MNTALRKALGPAFDATGRASEGELMARKLDYRWHLRQVMAARGMFATTDLIEPLAQRGIRLSSSQVYRLVVERPERLSLKILMALLDILDCSMNELIEPVAAATTGPQGSAPPAAPTPGVGAAAAQTGPHHRRRKLTGDRRVRTRGARRPGRGRCRPDRSSASRAWTGRRSRASSRSVAGGRAKRRRLAQALLDRPRVLDDGRSPAPRAVGDLLIALNKAGAARISAPVCAECGKHLRTLQRRGEDWYCGVCGPVREPCGECGRIRPIHRRDRDGQPRCVACPPDGGRDPLELAVDVIAAADAALSTDVAAAAVRRRPPGPGTAISLPGRCKTGPSCSPAPAPKHRSRRSCG